MNFLRIIVLASLVMFASAQCSGTWSPSATSSYVLTWIVSDDGLSVDFNVSVTTAANTWVAVGFSATQSMANSDIAIAADDGSNSFVEDRYAPGRVTPTFDTTQSFTNTMTERIGGRLSFSFTRLIDSADTSGQDVDLNVCQFVLWAWGGSVSSFTSPAAIGRHTSRGAFGNQICLQQCNRVSPSPSPTPDPSCSGTWSPSATSSYVLSWIVSDDGLSVDFNVSVTTAANTWVAVGFSATLNMLNSDIAIAADDGNNSFVEDRYAETRTRPIYDTTQSFTNTMTERIDDDLSFSFTRLIVSADTSGQDVDLNVCQYVLWAWGGSVINFTTPAIFNVHTRQGGFATQICLQQCNRVPVASVTPSPSPSSSSPIVIAVSMTLVSVSIFIAMLFSF